MKTTVSFESFLNFLNFQIKFKKKLFNMHRLLRRPIFYANIGATISSLMYLNNNMVMCAGSSEKKEIKFQTSSVFDAFLSHVKSRATGDEDQRILLGQEVGLGFTLGVTSGFALKKAARTILFTVRSSFRSLV